MTLVALPLFKIELSYLVRHGRRWTALEHLLLWAVAQDARNLADLCRDSGMPERLVVEALVNLLKVGWIELTTLRRGGATDAVLFTANRRGRGVVTLEELPYAHDIERRFASLYVDRLTAHVLDEEQLQLRHTDQIDRAATILLRPEYEKYDATPSRFFDRLNLRPDDYFERPLRHRVTSLAQFALLEVIGEHVSGLPDDAPAQLNEVILRRLPQRHWAEPITSKTAPERTARPLTARERFAPAAIMGDDLLIGGRDHRREFKRVIAGAKSIVYVHSTFMGQVIEAFIPDLVAAAEKGVDVVFLWGERRDPLREEPNQSEVKGRLAYRKIPPEWRERIRLARDPTGSHAKVLLADSGPNGEFEAVVGSCNWLSADYMGLELSVRLREPRLVQEVAGILADLSRPPSGAWGRDVTTLLKVQDRCRQVALERSNAITGSEPRAMLILDDEHYAAVRDARNAAARSVELGCDLFGPAGETTVFEPLGMAVREDKTAVRVLYNRPTETFVSELDDAVRRFSTQTMEVSQCPRLHGKFLTWNDETLIVTSFNWLAASIGTGHGSTGEVGILIQDAGLTTLFLRRLEAAAGVALKPGTPELGILDEQAAPLNDQA